VFGARLLYDAHMGRFTDRQAVRSRRRSREVALATPGMPVPTTGLHLRYKRRGRKMRPYNRPRLGGGFERGARGTYER
jgi:hypothetical protein